MAVTAEGRKDSFGLQGKVALVVGSLDPIGHALMVALAEAGADVAVTSLARDQRSEVLANSRANEVWALGRRGLALALDSRDSIEMEAAVDRVVAELGRLDILVNNHDLPMAKPALEITDAEWAEVFAYNVAAVFSACRPAARHMLARGSGRIINVTSILGERGLGNGAVYCAAKGAVINLTRSLALEWARAGVTVNAISTGFIEGGALARDERARSALERYLPFRRLGTPAEAASAVVYLASDASAFLTGQILHVDGTALAHE